MLKLLLKMMPYLQIQGGGETRAKEGPSGIEINAGRRNSRRRRMIRVDLEMRRKRFRTSLNPLLLIGGKARAQNWSEPLTVLCWGAAIFDYAIEKFIQ